MYPDDSQVPPIPTRTFLLKTILLISVEFWVILSPRESLVNVGGIVASPFTANILFPRRN